MVLSPTKPLMFLRETDSEYDLKLHHEIPSFAWTGSTSASPSGGVEAAPHPIPPPSLNWQPFQLPLVHHHHLQKQSVVSRKIVLRMVVERKTDWRKTVWMR